MLCHFENVKTKISIKQHKQFSHSLALLTHPFTSVQGGALNSFASLSLTLKSILAVQRTRVPGTGLQQN